MKVFIAGPRAITRLDESVESRLSNVIDKGLTVLVGDANGVDRLAQTYMHKMSYQNVIIYASNGIARNNVGNWPIQPIPVDRNVKGFDYYATKDKRMAEDADYGFMVWNGKSKGTMNNIINLTNANKKVLIFLTIHKKFYSIDSFEEAKTFFDQIGTESLSKNSLKNSITSIEYSSEQLSLFD